jgi:hypothetical protein
MEINFTQRWRQRKALFLQKQVFFNPRLHEIEKISIKIAAEWTVKHHYLGSFPSATVCYGIFRRGELSGVAVLGTAQHKNTIPNVFGPSRARDCLLLQRFALEDVLEFNAESYFLARIRALMKREGYCGILTMSDETPKTDALGNVTFPGHIGTIFKSDNAVYLGRSARSVEYLFDDGSVLSNRSFSKLVNNESGWNYVAEKLQSYGADDCPKTAGERREWGFYWRGQLTRKQQNFGKLRYAWSLHPKVRLPKSLPYPRFRFVDLQPCFFAAC